MHETRDVKTRLIWHGTRHYYYSGSGRGGRRAWTAMLFIPRLDMTLQHRRVQEWMSGSNYTDSLVQDAGCVISVDSHLHCHISL